MKKIEFELRGSSDLNSEEMREISGGAISPIWWGVIWDAINNFGDIREGFSDGFNGKPPRY